MERLILGIFVIGIILVLLVIYLNKKFKNKFIIYIPSIVNFVLGLVFFIWGNFFAESMQDLGMFVLTMICMALAVIAAVTALILRYKEIINKK